MVRFSEEQLSVFVDEFHASPCLWDVASAVYHRRDIRQAAMQRIAGLFNEDDDTAMTGEHAKIRSGKFLIYRPDADR